MGWKQLMVLSLKEKNRQNQFWINQCSRQLNFKWRSEEKRFFSLELQTVLDDNPTLNVRDWQE
jgi:diaminohydroxyphosphoribosylaminopyrimidine deaminase/5-amino-6-(5-phosphoribosylamino)uracil reductase